MKKSNKDYQFHVKKVVTDKSLIFSPSVAWKLDLKTPEYPKGREIVVIANDISHMIGSFGPKEDLMYVEI